MSETTTTTTPRRPRQPDQRLTDQQLAELITRERPYKVFDGNSLFVLVTPSGQRSWRWRYYIRGREKVLLLGSYPEVSLEQARAARDQARDKVPAGIDPADEKREAKLALLIAQESSFEAVARAWHGKWSVGRHERYAEDVMSRLERNVFPVLGHKPVDQIEPKHVVAMMERVQGRGATDVARRVRNTCSQVFRYAITEGCAAATRPPSSSLRTCCRSAPQGITPASTKASCPSSCERLRRTKARSSRASP